MTHQARRPGPYIPRQQSWSTRWAARGGTTVFYEGSPPPGATPDQLLVWAQELQRRCELVIQACQSARQDGKDWFYHPLTGKVGDIDLHLASAQSRQIIAGREIENAMAELCRQRTP